MTKNNRYDFTPPPFRWNKGTTTNNVDVNETVNNNTNASSVVNINNVTNVTNVVNANSTTPTNYIYGTNRNDVLTGTQYNDYIYGKGRNDVLTGNDGNDSLYGGKGRNTYYAKDGRQDFLYITRDARSKFDYKRADVIASADEIDRVDVLGVLVSKVKVREVLLPTGETQIGIFAKGRLEALYTGGDLTLSQIQSMVI